MRHYTPDFDDQLFTTNLDGAERAQISDDVRPYNRPTWSPDGRLIAAYSEPEAVIAFGSYAFSLAFRAALYPLAECG